MMTTPQHFQNEQLGSQGLLWVALTLGLVPVSPSQEVLAMTQMTHSQLILPLGATCPAQMTDHDFSAQKPCQILPAILARLGIYGFVYST